MHEKNLYITGIAPLINTPVIKVITGMRRVGKSCLLKLVIEKLRAGNVEVKSPWSLNLSGIIRTCMLMSRIAGHRRVQTP